MMSEERETYTTPASEPALDLDAIEARANAATPGPWEASRQIGKKGHCYVAQVFGPDALGGLSLAQMDVLPNATADAAFIAHARSDVPALVAEVRRLRKVTDAQAHELDRFILTADENDIIENLIVRLRRTMIDGELYGIEEQEAQMRYMLRSTFASLVAEVRRPRAENAALQERLTAALANTGGYKL
jgi:hypothetical protein